MPPLITTRSANKLLGLHLSTKHQFYIDHGLAAVETFKYGRGVAHYWRLSDIQKLKSQLGNRRDPTLKKKAKKATKATTDVDLSKIATQFQSFQLSVLKSLNMLLSTASAQTKALNILLLASQPDTIDSAGLLNSSNVKQAMENVSKQLVPQ